jgi:hypothetical protein
MRSIFVILSAVAMLSLSACAGMYVAGDAGPQSEHKDLTGR